MDGVKIETPAGDIEWGACPTCGRYALLEPLPDPWVPVCKKCWADGGLAVEVLEAGQPVQIVRWGSN